MHHKKSILDHFDRRLLAYESWITPCDELFLKESERQVYRVRVACVMALVDSNGDVKKASEAGQCSRFEVYRTLKRCTTILEDGTIAGFRGCLYYFHVRQYTLKRLTPRATAGLLSYIFREYPQVERGLRDFVLGRGNRLSRIHAPGDYDILLKFKELCRQAGVQANGYPFSAKKGGLRSLWEWKRRLSDKRRREFASEYFGEEEANNIASGTSSADHKYIDEYKTWVFDEYTIDTAVTVAMLGKTGAIEWLPMERFKIISGRRRGSRDVLVSVPVLVKEPSSTYILQAIELAIRPHARREFDIPGYKYPDGHCFASEFLGCEWQVPDLVLLDRSLAHQANETRRALTEVLGGFVEFGIARQPKKRADIEAWHSFLASEFRRLPSTTGTGPSDSRRRNPDAAALTLRLTEHEIFQLIELLAARFNAMHRLETLKGNTPMESFQCWVQEPDTILRCVPSQIRNTFSLQNKIVEVSISCTRRSGRQPVVRYQYADYCGPSLDSRRSRDGERCRIVIADECAHVAKLCAPDGKPIDVLRAKGIWSTPHRLADRITYSQLRKNGRIRSPRRDESPTDILREYLSERARSNRSDALKYAEISRAAALRDNGETTASGPQLEDSPPVSKKPNILVPRMKSAGDW